MAYKAISDRWNATCLPYSTQSTAVADESEGSESLTALPQDTMDSHNSDIIGCCFVMIGRQYKPQFFATCS